jgi:hypothetical protein
MTFETLNALAVNLFFHHVLFSTHATMAEQNNEQKGPAASVDPFSKQALHERSKRKYFQTHMENVVLKMEQEVLAWADLEKTFVILSTSEIGLSYTCLSLHRVIVHWNKLHPDVHATHVSDHVVRLNWA